MLLRAQLRSSSRCLQQLPRTRPRRLISGTNKRRRGAAAIHLETTPPLVSIEPRVRKALEEGLPVVALESTIISHGMPYPDNLAMARCGWYCEVDNDNFYLSYPVLPRLFVCFYCGCPRSYYAVSSQPNIPPVRPRRLGS